MRIDLGKALIRFREDCGLTRKELYEKVGISKNRLSQLENNTNKNSEIAIKNILKHFDVSYSDFLIVYAGLKINGRSFDSLESLKEYKKQNKDNLKQNIESIENENIEQYKIQKYTDMIEYLETEATSEEINSVIDLVNYFMFRKYEERDYLQWKKEQNKSTPE